MKNKKIRLFVTASLFAALIFIFTALAPKIPTPSGYYHIGDTFIYLCASLIPFPFCALAAAIGASLADLFAGYVSYAPATFLIKGLMALIAFGGFRLMHGRLGNLPARVICGAAAEIVMILGYFVFHSTAPFTRTV